MAERVMLRRLIADAYSKGWSIARVAAELSVGRSIVYRELKTMGVPRRSRATKGIRCVDCGKRCYPARRCDYHRKIRNAEMNLEWKRVFER